MKKSGVFPLFSDNQDENYRRRPGARQVVCKRFCIFGRIAGKDGSVCDRQIGGQFDRVAVGVVKEELTGTVGSCEWAAEGDVVVVKECHGGFKVVDFQGMMGADPAPVGEWFAIGDKMEFLGGTIAIPCAGEGEGGPRYFLEPEDIAVEPAALCEIGDVEGDVIEFLNAHGLEDSLEETRGTRLFR